MIILAQNGIQLVLQGSQNLGYNGFGIRIGQGTVIGAQFQRKSHALLSFRNTGAAVNIKQLYAAQKLAGSCGDDIAKTSSFGSIFFPSSRSISANAE